MFLVVTTNGHILAPLYGRYFTCKADAYAAGVGAGWHIRDLTVCPVVWTDDSDLKENHYPRRHPNGACPAMNNWTGD